MNAFNRISCFNMCFTFYGFFKFCPILHLINCKSLWLNLRAVYYNRNNTMVLASLDETYTVVVSTIDSWSVLRFLGQEPRFGRRQLHSWCNRLWMQTGQWMTAPCFVLLIADRPCKILLCCCVQYSVLILVFKHKPTFLVSTSHGLAYNNDFI